MPPRPVVHFEIHGKDRKKLGEFYRALFEWELDPQDAMNYTMVGPGVGGPPEGVGGGIAPDGGRADGHRLRPGA